MPSSVQSWASNVHFSFKVSGQILAKLSQSQTWKCHHRHISRCKFQWDQWNDKDTPVLQDISEGNNCLLSGTISHTIILIKHAVQSILLPPLSPSPLRGCFLSSPLHLKLVTRFDISVRQLHNRHEWPTGLEYHKQSPRLRHTKVHHHRCHYLGTALYLFPNITDLVSISSTPNSTNPNLQSAPGHDMSDRQSCHIWLDWGENLIRQLNSQYL